MTGLLSLPNDSIEEILQEVDAFDIKSLCESSRVIRDISNNSKAVWVTQAKKLVEQWIPVPLPKSETLGTCSTSEVKDAVLRAAYLDVNWIRQNPRLVSPIKKNESLRVVKAQNTVNFVSNYVVISRYESYGSPLRIMYCDIKDGSCLWEGVFEFESVDRSTIFVRQCGMRWNSDSDILHCFCFIHVLVHGDEGRNNHWLFKLCKADVPKTARPSDTFIFREIHPIPFQHRGRQHLDFNLNILLTLFQEPEDNANILHMDIQRWDTKEKISLDFEDRAAIHEDICKGVVTYLPLRNEIVLRSIYTNKEIVTSIPSSTGLVYTKEMLKSLPQIIYSFKSDLDVPGNYGNWQFSETLFYYPWHSSMKHCDPGRPRALYSCYLFERFNIVYNGKGRQWQLIQYYWSEGGPYGKRRCIVRSSNVVHAEPVATSFRYAAWIEERIRTKKERKDSKIPGVKGIYLMLARFPPPKEDADELTKESIVEVKPVKLDVPTQILRTVRELHIAESEGVITIISKEGEFYILRYA